MLCFTLPARISGNNPGSLPQDDNDIYKAKRKEALQKYEMLVNTQFFFSCCNFSQNGPNVSFCFPVWLNWRNSFSILFRAMTMEQQLDRK